MKNTTKNETKLIIEGKEFELIKYSCDLNDKWYCGELGLMIEKKIIRRDDLNFYKRGDIIWNGAGCGKEDRQLEKLIWFGEETVKDWKQEVKRLDPVLESEKKRSFEAKLARAENGLNELKELQKSK